jgi:hypothetical protein
MFTLYETKTRTIAANNKQSKLIILKYKTHFVLSKPSYVAKLTCFKERGPLRALFVI